MYLPQRSVVCHNQMSNNTCLGRIVSVFIFGRIRKEKKKKKQVWYVIGAHSNGIVFTSGRARKSSRSSVLRVGHGDTTDAWKISSYFENIISCLK